MLKIKQKIKTLLEKSQQIATSFSSSLMAVFLLLLALDIAGIIQASVFLNLHILCVIASISFVAVNLVYKGKKQIPEYLFLAFLILATLSSLNLSLVSFLARYNDYFLILTVVFGFILLYHRLRRVETDVEREKIDEESKEKTRYCEFDKKSPFSFLSWLNLSYGVAERFKNKKWLSGVFRVIISPFIWLIRLPYRFFRWCYAEGWVYSILLLAIFVLFIFSKAPYFETTFTGDGATKYSAHVGAAIQMQENNNPFLSKYVYAVDPINSPDGLRTKFGPFPYLEWGFLLTNSLFQKSSIEFNTRLFLSIIGIIMLFYVYLCFKKIISKEYSLIVTYLLSIDFIFALLTFVPLQDLFALLFMFVSVHYLFLFKQKNEMKSLVLSGIFFGLGVISKQSLLVWYAPIAFLMVLFISKNNFKEAIRHYLVLMLFNFLIIVTYFAGFRYFPSLPLISGIASLLLIAVTIRVADFCIKKEELIKNTLEKMYRSKYLLIGGIFLAIIAILISFYLLGIYKLFGEFITDQYLLFNPGVYLFIIEQIKANAGVFVWTLFIPGMLLSFFVKKKDSKYLWAFVAGSAVYLVVASKSIFFHSHYLFIMIFSMILFTAFLLFYFLKTANKKVRLVCFLVIIALTLSPSLASIKTEFSFEQKNLLLVADYLNENMNSSELYLDEGYVLYPSFKYQLGRVSQLGLLESPEVLSSIREIGFNQTMHKYSIKYIVTNRDQLRYDRLINIFASDMGLQDATYRRTDIIFERLYGKDYFAADRPLREKLINELRIREKFVLEKQFGSYKIYSFKD